MKNPDGVTVAKLVKRLSYDLRPEKSIEYIGCNAINLGDQAVGHAVDRLFSGVTVRYPKSPHGTFGNMLRTWENRRKRLASLLGGGTMIGPWPFGDAERFEESLKRTGLGFAFGSGVADLVFPPDRELYLNDPSVWNKWIRLLKQCHYVGVRGPRSQAVLADRGVTTEVLGDTACGLTRPPGFWQPRSGHLGVNVGYGGGSMWGDRARFNQSMSQFVANVVRQGWTVEFFALMHDDFDIIQHVAQMAGIADPIVHCEFTNPDRYLKRVGKMQAFIGMKVHSVILAMCAHVPSIMLEYRPKGIDFMASVGQERFNVRTSDVEPAALLELLDDLVGQGARLSEKIQERMNAYRELQVTRAQELIALAQERRFGQNHRRHASERWVRSRTPGSWGSSARFGCSAISSDAALFNRHEPREMPSIGPAATYEATVEKGQIKILDAVSLPENAKIFVVVPGREEGCSYRGASLGLS